MILSEDIVRQVLSGKRSMIRLPIKTRPCPYKEGRAYVVKTATRAPISCHITISNVSEALVEDQNMWVIRFVKGDHTDKPRLLKARPGGEQYTSVPALALRNELEAVSDQLLERYAAQGRENHADVLKDQRERLLKAVMDLRLQAAKQRSSSTARKRLKSVEHHLRAMDQEARASA